MGRNLLPEYVWPDPDNPGWWVDAWNGVYDNLPLALEDAARGVGRPWVLRPGEGIISEAEVEERRQAAARADAVRSLLVDWMRAEAGLIGEFSGDITAEYKALVVEAQQRAEAVGVPWSEDLVPVYVSEAIRWASGE